MTICFRLGLILLSALSVFAQPVMAQDKVSGAAARDAVAQILRNQGLVPAPDSDLSLSDYITTNAAVKDAGMRHATVLMDAEGRMLPTAQWREFHPDYCKNKARVMVEPARMLGFKISRVHERVSKSGRERNQLFAFAGVTDIETGLYLTRANAEVSNANWVDSEAEGYVYDAFLEAYDKLDPAIQSPGDVCGEVRVRHLEGSVVGEELVFFAGYRGYHGSNLTYSWDFGDGSAPVSGTGLKRVTHVYDKQGSYTVTVRVTYEDGGTATGDVVAKVGVGVFALDLSSRHWLMERGRKLFDITVAGSIPLKPTGQAFVYEGTAPLHTAECQSPGSEMIQKLLASVPPGMPFSLRDLSLLECGEVGIQVTARVTLAGDQENQGPIEANLKIRRAGANSQTQATGIWLSAFVTAHQAQFKGHQGLDVTGWQRSDAPGVIAGKDYSFSMGNTAFLETDLTLRGKKPAAAVAVDN